MSIQRQVTPMTAPRGPVTARLGRRSERGVMWGLSAGQLIAVGAAAALVGPAAMSAGLTGLLVTAPGWVAALVFAFVRPRGKTVAAWTPVVANWMVRRIGGQTRWLARPGQLRPAGTLALPGEVASLRVYVHTSSGTAMIHDPHRRTLTGVIRLSHPSFPLLSPDEQNRRVTAWGSVLSGACRTGHVCGLQLVERTLPDHGDAVQAHWHHHGYDGTGLAADSYRALIASAGPASARHETLMALTLSLKAAAAAIRSSGRGVAGAAHVLMKELTTVAASLRTAELGVEGFLSEDELARVIDTAFTSRPPATEGSGTGVAVDVAGPVGVATEWDHVRIDDGWHAVLWVREWPRQDVDASFLTPLMLTNTVRRTISLFYRPRTTRQALKELRTEQAEQESEQRRRDKHDIRTTAAQQREQEDIDRRERELVVGHADLPYTGLIAVSGSTREDLDEAVAEVESACHQCGLDTSLLVGQQDAAFYAAALPLGRLPL
ncbi:SCO6880 family protein [Phytoactinopolyspora halotolerans]|uniref:PrgI family protein n=1 Tax=Phytoactinopolyspora halotolerans TaxID=1981512 RepID=A0A6L9S830_9ACTN|nr:SCO6880 family protein [Phytoactinopolyspora halotolerans]NEE01197.1 PrgI family protein [Phytoactinopolyspora halotolerans]